MVQRSDVIVSSLFDEVAVRQVYAADDGLTSVKLDGRLLIDTSTVPPEVGPEIAAMVTAAGGRFVDAPVLGMADPARAGLLVTLIGGHGADVAEARRVMAIVSREVHIMGANGAGYAGKLAITLLKGIYWAALGDCFTLARRYGIEVGSILDVIEGGRAHWPNCPTRFPSCANKPAMSASRLKASPRICGICWWPAAAAKACPSLPVRWWLRYGRWRTAGRSGTAAIALHAASLVATATVSE